MLKVLQDYIGINNKNMFKPQVGLKTNDSYLHGIGEELETIGEEGIIEAVGKDWFVYRCNNKPILVEKKDYDCIEENDFN
jgi:hypothetical protein